jgi:hypothetical protein
MTDADEGFLRPKSTCVLMPLPPPPLLEGTKKVMYKETYGNIALESVVPERVRTKGGGGGGLKAECR